MRILVVDDDSLAGQMTGAVLEAAGYEIALAEDGMTAAQMLNADAAIGVVVSDMNMPVISGIDLFRELRAQGVKLPFVLLTGDDPAPLLAAEPGLDACIMKDFSIEASLPAAVAEALANHDRDRREPTP